MNMKIEKLNENQIRCTLTRADLAERQLQLSELAYGTEKAKSLFHDMMQQAAFEFGFEAEDIPLMIEAIPASSDSIVLIITKVEDPEELDTRFSKFAPAAAAEGDFQKNLPSKLEGADSLLELLDKVKEKLSAAENEKAAEKEEQEEKTAPRRPVIRLSLLQHWTVCKRPPDFSRPCTPVPTPFIRMRPKISIFWRWPSPDIPIRNLTGSATCSPSMFSGKDHRRCSGLSGRTLQNHYSRSCSPDPCIFIMERPVTEA